MGPSNGGQGLEVLEVLALILSNPELLYHPRAEQDATAQEENRGGVGRVRSSKFKHNARQPVVSFDYKET
jgi:hypothetical protein